MSPVPTCIVSGQEHTDTCRNVDTVTSDLHSMTTAWAQVCRATMVAGCVFEVTGALEGDSEIDSVAFCSFPSRILLAGCHVKSL